MKLLRHIFIISLILLTVHAVYGIDHFDEGIKAANKKDYKKAIQSFEKVLEKEKGNASAYFNLGNCYYESKKYGKAILMYEKVLKYEPRDSEAPLNIELCYKKLGITAAWSSHTNGIQRLIYGVGSNRWAYLAIIVSVLLSLCLFGFIRSKTSSWRRLYFILIFGQAVLLISFIIAASGASKYQTLEKFAIVTKKIIPTYMNDLGEKAQLQIQEGTKLELVQPTKSNFEVRLMDGRSILVSPKDIEII